MATRCLFVHDKLEYIVSVKDACDEGRIPSKNGTFCKLEEREFCFSLSHHPHPARHLSGYVSENELVIIFVG